MQWNALVVEVSDQFKDWQRSLVEVSPKLGRLGDWCVSAMAGASGSVQVLAGPSQAKNEDPLKYKRWKTWVLNKLLTVDTKVPKEARGVYVYTLLSGRALDCVEHLEPGDYQVVGGEVQEKMSFFDCLMPGFLKRSRQMR